MTKVHNKLKPINCSYVIKWNPVDKFEVSLTFDLQIPKSNRVCTSTDSTKFEAVGHTELETKLNKEIDMALILCLPQWGEWGREDSALEERVGTV